MPVAARTLTSIPRFSTILHRHYPNVDWTRQQIVLGVLGARINEVAAVASRRRGEPRSQIIDDGFVRHTPVWPNCAWWGRALRMADLWCPSTMHRMFCLPNRVADSSHVDTIPCLTADLDYPSQVPHEGSVFLQLSDLGIPPTIMVRSPRRGYHLFWYLRDPLVMRWERAEGTGVWRLSNGAAQGLAWWRDISFRLHAGLVYNDIPADPTGAGNAARMMRRPRGGNVVGVWPKEYTLDEMTTRLDPYRALGHKRCTVGGMEFSTIISELVQMPGAEEGQRDQVGYRFAMAVVAATAGNEILARRICYAWAARCVPQWSQREMEYCVRYALRLHREKRLFFWGRKSMPSCHSGLNRSDAARRTHRIRRIRSNDAIAGAISEMVQEGIPEPIRRVSEVARRAGVDRKTVTRYRKEILSELNQTGEYGL
jgi:hypothetical protein